MEFKDLAFSLFRTKQFTSPGLETPQDRRCWAIRCQFHCSITWILGVYGEGWKGKTLELVNCTVFSCLRVPWPFSLDAGLIFLLLTAHPDHSAIPPMIWGMFRTYYLTWYDARLRYHLRCFREEFVQNWYHFHEFLKSAKWTVLVKDIHVIKMSQTQGMREKATRIVVTWGGGGWRGSRSRTVLLEGDWFLWPVHELFTVLLCFTVTYKKDDSAECRVSYKAKLKKALGL